MKSNLFSLLASTFLLAIGSAKAAITTEYLAANGLNFTCTALKHTSQDPDAPTKHIMLLHGFPMFRVWWDPLLSYWESILQNGELKSPLSVHAVACDLRGYSPGASPDAIEEYTYPVFAQDAFALAKAAGFDQGFHLLGHDHGAGLAWYMAANDPNNQILSLAPLSVPHVGLFSDALCGENSDHAQVIASNYMNQFALPDSASRNDAGLTKILEGFMGPLEPEKVQKMLWWYHGSVGKYLSSPRVVSDTEVDEHDTGVGKTWFVKAVRAAIPMEEKPCLAIDEKDKVGAIEIPTLFVCGTHDFALLCNNPFATEFATELLPNYEHVNFDCGHDFFLEDNCISMEETRSVMDKITTFVLGEIERSVENDSQAEEL